MNAENTGKREFSNSVTSLYPRSFPQCLSHCPLCSSGSISHHSPLPLCAPVTRVCLRSLSASSQDAGTTCLLTQMLFSLIFTKAGSFLSFSHPGKWPCVYLPSRLTLTVRSSLIPGINQPPILFSCFHSFQLKTIYYLKLSC